MTTNSTPLSPAIRITTVASVCAVAFIAAVVSYSHMQQLAQNVGENWRSWLIPLSIDGLVVASSMTLLTRHRAGMKGGRLPWAERFNDWGTCREIQEETERSAGIGTDFGFRRK